MDAGQQMGGHGRGNLASPCQKVESFRPESPATPKQRRGQEEEEEEEEEKKQEQFWLLYSIFCNSVPSWITDTPRSLSPSLLSLALQRQHSLFAILFFEASIEREWKRIAQLLQIVVFPLFRGHLTDRISFSASFCAIVIERWSTKSIFFVLFFQLA